jgi:predicted amidohydrolase YtcJ
MANDDDKRNPDDLAVLDRDWFTAADDDLKRTRSLLTVAGGRVVHNDGMA